MDNVDKLFFELIRVSLGTQGSLSRFPSDLEWTKLYKMAEKQSLLGVCFVGLQNLGANADEGYVRIGIPKEVYFQWVGMAAHIQLRNERVNKQCVELQTRLSEEGFQTYIMKGQGNSILYRSMHDNTDLCLLRQPGDIDIYLDGGYRKVMKFVNETYPTREVNELEIHYHCFFDTEVEIHYRAFIMRNPFKNRKLQKFFKAEGHECYLNKVKLPSDVGEIAVPTSAFNLVHQMVHIYHHLLIGGVGMRQLMDYFFVLKHEAEIEKGVNAQKVQVMIKSLGLDTFASALMWILHEIFGLENEQMLWKPHKINGEFLLNEVIRSGNFGNYDTRLPRKRTKWQSFWILSIHNLRLLRFTYDDWFWGPLWRLYHFVWRKCKGYK